MWIWGDTVPSRTSSYSLAAASQSLSRLQRPECPGRGPGPLLFSLSLYMWVAASCPSVKTACLLLTPGVPPPWVPLLSSARPPPSLRSPRISPRGSTACRGQKRARDPLSAPSPSPCRLFHPNKSPQHFGGAPNQASLLTLTRGGACLLPRSPSQPRLPPPPWSTAPPSNGAPAGSS